MPRVRGAAVSVTTKRCSSTVTYSPSSMVCAKSSPTAKPGPVHRRSPARASPATQRPRTHRHRWKASARRADPNRARAFPGYRRSGASGASPRPRPCRFGAAPKSEDRNRIGSGSLVPAATVSLCAPGPGLIARRRRPDSLPGLRRRLPRKATDRPRPSDQGERSHRSPEPAAELLAQRGSALLVERAAVGAAGANAGGKRPVA
jgi:hypothetical protein